MKSKFESWFKQQPFYLNLRFIHGDRIFASENSVYRVLAVQIAWMTWMEQQKRVDAVLTKLDELFNQKWGEWKTQADMYAQGQANAYEHSQLILEQALKGGDE